MTKKEMFSRFYRRRNCSFVSLITKNDGTIKGAKYEKNGDTFTDNFNSTDVLIIVQTQGEC